MQKQLGGRTDTLKQALIDQKEGQLEQLRENVPDVTDTDVQMIQKIQDVHLERLWSNFLATGTPLPPAPLAEEPTLASMLRQLGSRDPGQSKGDKEEMMAQFAQQLEAERRKSLVMMVRPLTYLLCIELSREASSLDGASASLSLPLWAVARRPLTAPTGEPGGAVRGGEAGAAGARGAAAPGADEDAAHRGGDQDHQHPAR